MPILHIIFIYHFIGAIIFSLLSILTDFKLRAIKLKPSNKKDETFWIIVETIIGILLCPLLIITFLIINYTIKKTLSFLQKNIT